MNDDYDVYVLCDERSVRRVEEFLSVFSPNREAVATEYEFPYLADDPVDTYSTPEPLIGRLIREFDQTYSLYWRSSEGRGRSTVMLFFTSDGGMIAGLGGWNLRLEVALSQLQRAVRGKFGYVSVGSPPPDSAAKFIALSKTSDLPKLYDGMISGETV